MKKALSSGMNKYHIAVSAMLLLSPEMGLAKDSTTEALENFGDIMQYALPLTAFGATYIADDEEGRSQFYKSFFTALGTTTALKGVYSKLRPESKSRTSFPSGHTTAAFAGAAFIDQRYGHGWGAVALTAAGITGYSRIRSENHFADDVLAGASIALMSNWLWTTPYQSNVTLTPAIIGNGVGLNLAVNDAVVSDQPRIAPAATIPKMRYQLAMGGAGLKRNYVTAPSSTGTTFNMHNFERRDDPVTSASGILDWYVSQTSTWRFAIWPFESRDNGQFTQPVSFAGSTFPANTNINSAWRHYDFRATYIYNFEPGQNWKAGVGAALSAQFTEIDLETDDKSVIASVDDQVLLPLIYASVGYRFSPRLDLVAEASGISASNDTMLDAGLTMRYELDRYWDVGIGIGLYEREIDTSDLKNDLRYNVSYITVGYSFY